MGSPVATTTTHGLSLTVARLSDRITSQRVGSTQQLVLAGTPCAPALGAGMFVARAGPLAGGERSEALDERLGMHRLPDGEVALKLNLVVRSRERLWPCCGVDDPAVDDLYEALATSQVVSEGGGRGRCVSS
jgi:hypothetical protein